MKITKYLYIPALFLIVSGSVAGIIAQIWLPIPLLLIILGIILLIWWSQRGKVGESFRYQRFWETSTNSLITTTAVIAILAMVNFFAVRHPVVIDFTENQIFSLSPQSVAAVENLEQPLKVWIFQPDLPANEKSLLENYSRQNPNFTFQLVDPEVELALAQQFEVQYVGEVYLEYQDKRQPLPKITNDQPLTEALLTNGILKIQRSQDLAIYFLQGHGEPTLDQAERSLANAATTLAEQGYQVQTLNLGETKTIPEGADLIAIIGPRRELLAGEVTALAEYLKAGGKLLIMVDPQTSPGLENLLKPWGVQLDERVIIDASGTGNIIGYGPAAVIITSYGDHPITTGFGNNISIFPFSRAISTEPKSAIEAVALLITDPQTWAEADVETEPIEFDEEEDIPGPLDLAVALSQEESRLVVFGNASFALNGWIEQQLNQDVFLNTVEWLTNDEEMVVGIGPKEPNNRRLQLTPKQSAIVSWSALLVVPLLGLVTAVVTWWKRR